MHLKAGQALVFQDSLVHGAAARVNPDGWRRTLCFRYLPQEFSTDRFGHMPSEALMARLTPARRSILTQMATEHDPWGQSHLQLVEAGRGREDGEPGHTYSAKI
jgi:ectoine hydroxylase-related dioxygenase (phytanoyl-CoA dioxygenase family)